MSPTAAGIALVTPDGCALFLKRSLNSDHPGTWCLPGGGIEGDEPAEIAAIRELREETGWIAPEGSDPPKLVRGNQDKYATFKQRVNNPFIPTLDHEHTAWAWAPLHDPPDPVHPGLKKDLVMIATDEQPVAATTPSSGFPAMLAGWKKKLAASDMNLEDVTGILGGLAKFFGEELDEPEHAEDNSEPQTLYVHRPLANAGAIAEWAHSQGFKNALAPDDMHATVAFSKQPLRWNAAGQPQNDSVSVAGGARSVEKLGDDGAVVLRFESPDLAGRWQHFKDAGASWDHDGYRPHVTLTYDPGDVDLSKVQPYDGPLEFGPEVFGPTTTREQRTEIEKAIQDFKTEHGRDPTEAERVDILAGVQGADSEVAAANDSSAVFALDKDSVRELDADGRMHVTRANISKANVCPYRGKEIPNWQGLGLEPEKIYNLYRDPKELKKAASTFNGIQLLKKHVPVDANDHRMWDIVGTTGTTAKFEDPFLTNSLHVWTRDGIDMIESDEQKELSCGYRYKPDMTPGEIDGTQYDGVMRDIIGNHVALVKDGRAGDDVVVGDSTENLEMTSRPTKFAAFLVARTGRAVYPLLAMDQKVELMPIFKDVTLKNFKAQKPQIIAGLKSALKGKVLAQDGKTLAQDAEPHMGHVAAMLDHLEHNAPSSASLDESVSPEQHKAMEAAAHGESTLGIPKDVGEEFAEADKGKTFDAEGFKNFLKEKGMDEESIAKCMDMMPKPALDAEESEEEKKKREEAEAKKAADSAAAAAREAGEDPEAKDKNMVTKDSLDATLKAALEGQAKSLGEKIRGEQRAIRMALDEVKPYVGELAPSLALDSADDVYRTALDMLGVAEAKSIHSSALKTVLGLQPKPGARPVVNRDQVVIAADAATVKSFNERYPGAAHIETL